LCAGLASPSSVSARPGFGIDGDRVPDSGATGAEPRPNHGTRAAFPQNMGARDGVLVEFS